TRCAQSLRSRALAWTCARANRATGRLPCDAWSIDMIAEVQPSGLSDTDLAAVLAVQRLASEVVAPLARDTDAHAAFPWTQIRALAEIGVLGMNLPVQWGGAGISAPAFA